LDFIITIIAFGFLIFVHELGHFSLARLFKIKIEVFSIGLGPKLYSFEKNGTQYALSLIPLGGYCKMKGENLGTKQNVDPDSFPAKHWWERCFVIFGGAFYNFLFALLLITFSFAIGRTYEDLEPRIYSIETPFLEVFQRGDLLISVNDHLVSSFSGIFSHLIANETNIFVVQRTSATSIEDVEIPIFIEQQWEFMNSLKPVVPNIVGEISPGLPAWRAGILPGDQIIAINDTETNNWYDIKEAINTSNTKEIKLFIKRNGEQLNLLVTPENNPLSNENSRIIGITHQLNVSIHEEYTLWESCKIGLFSTISLVKANYNALFLLLKKPSNLKNSVSGPIMLFYMTSETSKKGLTEMLFFVAAVSILLMIMNLLPIPVFDGGQIIFCLYEGLFKRTIPHKIQMIMQQIGLIFIIFLMIYAFYSDLSRIFQKSISSNELKRHYQPNELEKRR